MPIAGSGTRPAPVIVGAWDLALKTAFGGLKFTHPTGKQPTGTPLGYWTTELKTIS